MKQSHWFPADNPARFRRPDGTLDVLAYCRWLDANYNASLGAAAEQQEDREKGAATCGNAREQGFDSATMGATETSAPRAAGTAGELADPSGTGADNG